MLMVDKKSQGFTMIEMMVVIVILGIIASIALPSYTNVMNSSLIKTQVESYKHGVQLARAEAIRMNQSIEFRLNADKSWEIGCTTEVLPDCPGTIRREVQPSVSALTVELSDASGGAVAAGAGLTFSSLGIASGALAQVDVRHTSNNDATALRMQLEGASVRMCDPAITDTTDIRKCL